MSEQWRRRRLSALEKGANAFKTRLLAVCASLFLCVHTKTCVQNRGCVDRLWFGNEHFRVPSSLFSTLCSLDGWGWPLLGGIRCQNKHIFDKLRKQSSTIYYHYCAWEMFGRCSSSNKRRAKHSTADFVDRR